MVWITTNLTFSAMLRKICNTVEAYLEPSRTFSIELFVEIVRGFLLLTIFAKRYIIYVFNLVLNTPLFNKSNWFALFSSRTIKPLSSSLQIENCNWLHNSPFVSFSSKNVLRQDFSSKSTLYLCRFFWSDD